MSTLLYEGALFADYFQLYLRDEDHPGLPEDYTDVAVARRLMVAPYAAILHTARNMDVPLRVEWHERPPARDVDAWQHVAEAHFACPSGRLVLAGLSDFEPDAPRLPVTAGPLGLRASFAGLDTLSEDGLDGDDRYRIQLWPEVGPQDVQLLKAWPAA